MTNNGNIQPQLAQYIRLYESMHRDIDHGSAPALNRLRGKAHSYLTEHGQLPRIGDEGYERTSPLDMLAPDYGMDLHRLAHPTLSDTNFKCGIPNISTLHATVIGDTPVENPTLASRLPQGVLFGSLRQIALSHPQLVEQYYGTVATPQSDTLTALNALFAQDGVMLYVPKEIQLKKPLQLVQLLQSAQPYLATRRLLVVLEKGASAQLLVCDHTSDSTQHYLSLETVEIILHPQARLDMYCLEESSPLTQRLWQLHAHQEAGSQLNLSGFTITCGRTRNSYNINLCGQYAQTHLDGMAIGSNSMVVDNNINLTHTAPNTISRQMFKYVLDHSSRGAFGGRILVKADAIHTDAAQNCRTILANETAQMHAKPQLEIYCDDVKCSHGATTGQLDEQALFYMRTRGIPEPEARHMLMEAFMADVISQVKIDGLNDRLRHMVAQRFSNNDTSYAGCHTCPNQQQ